MERKGEKRKKVNLDRGETVLCQAKVNHNLQGISIYQSDHVSQAYTNKRSAWTKFCLSRDKTD